MRCLPAEMTATKPCQASVCAPPIPKGARSSARCEGAEASWFTPGNCARHPSSLAAPALEAFIEAVQPIEAVTSREVDRLDGALTLAGVPVSYGNKGVITL